MLLLLGTAAGVFFILMLFWQLSQRARVSKRVLASALLVSGVCVTWLGVKLTVKIYHGGVRAAAAVGQRFAPRSGSEIYTALFGKGVACTQVMESLDQVVPKIDIAIWLHFRTCPSEFRRLVARHPFSAKKQATAHWQQDILGAEGEKWFRPQAMGDTVLVYQYATKDNRNIQTFWASLDSTEVFYRDILD
ncbi:MAG: hypothetical protein EOO63_13850 [Hymenobacter sp.]|nr:MAG: hypothetical protein EOO63_13850 [Hymenobacter sp.]